MVRPFFRRIISAGHKDAASRTPHKSGMRMRAEFISNSGRSIVTKVLPRGVLIMLLLVATAARAEDAAPASATNLYHQLSSVRLDPDRVFRVRDLSIEIHEIHITFTAGVIAFTNSVNGEVTGAYFQGEGEALVR